MMPSPVAEAFLREHTRTFLVTLRPDGAPTCHPMVGFWQDGALWLNTYRKSAKARNLMRSPRVDDEDPQFRGVVLRGRAEIVESAAPLRSGTARPPAVGGDVARLVQARLAEGKRVVVRIVPDEMRLVGEHR
jgi:PPOX class probable F420-dependent enzyme